MQEFLRPGGVLTVMSDFWTSRDAFPTLSSLSSHGRTGSVPTMTTLFEAGPDRRVPVPPGTRFLIRSYVAVLFALMQFPIAGGLLAAASASVQAAELEWKPNILLIVSDDHGYADTGFQGAKDCPTLERLRHGTRNSCLRRFAARRAARESYRPIRTEGA